jgi:hypothetical protein
MNTLDQTLELFASRAVDETAVEDAQRRLEALLATRTPRKRRSHARGWLAAAISAVVGAVALFLLPIPSNPALAFSAVQKQLRDFKTLRFVMEQRLSGFAGPTTIESRVSMTHDGNVRTEVGPDLVVVVNSAERRVLTLMKSARVAQVTPLDRPVEKSEQLDWLEEIREFQGAANLLPLTRIIDFQRVQGWQLIVGEMNMVIWATEEGVPLEMTVDRGAALQLEMHFELDVPLAADLFSTRVPDGYRLGEDED